VHNSSLTAMAPTVLQILGKLFFTVFARLGYTIIFM